MDWATHRENGGVLAQALAGAVSADVESRGLSYFRNGRVRIEHGGPDFVAAVVRGSNLYDVQIMLDDDVLRVDCTCPYFEDHGFCKHLWATVLAADARGDLTDAAKGRFRQIEDLDATEGPAATELETDPDDFASLLARRPPRGERRYTWKSLLQAVESQVDSGWDRPSAAAWPEGQEVLYVLDRENTLSTGRPDIGPLCRRPKKNGELSKLMPLKANLYGSEAPVPLDRQLLAILAAASPAHMYGYSYAYAPGVQGLSLALAELLLPMLCRSGRFYLRPSQEQPQELVGPLALDEGAAWELELRVARETAKEYVARGVLRRPGEEMPLAEPLLLLSGGWLFTRERVARLNNPGIFPWIGFLRTAGELRVPEREAAAFIERLFSGPPCPRLDLPTELHVEEVSVPPLPRLVLRPPHRSYERDLLAAELSFRYDGETVPEEGKPAGILQADRRRFIRRDREAERQARRRLEALRFQRDPYAYGKNRLALRTKHVPGVVRQLLTEGWQVEAEGKLFRRAGAFDIEVRSGVDWFELHGRLDFDGVGASMPALLAALHRGENTVLLDDGSVGMLPEEWVKKWAPLSATGAAEGDHLRFVPSQVALLDALLAAQPEARCDETFRRAREQLLRFESVEPADAPPAFVGQLRPYQREGLGWLHFLRRFRLGGCLADDMGLGKTVQVLALLDARREERLHGAPDVAAFAPSLVVAPRSLLFNWKEEAARFTPKLRLLEHAGFARQREQADFTGFDLILTTYGTLRRDIAFLKDVTFDYAILDEAQAVKNAGTASAKAARLLQARHRLALSGTPVENHIGELWSLVEFLNPGMLGSAPLFQTGLGRADDTDGAARTLLRRALRPIILRRTKAQVARDLPERTEQTVYCQLEGKQRRQYDELRDHYRRTLLARIDQEGLAKSKMHVLEALLRLRQAACHPGLLDKARTAEPSAKLESLIPQLAEVTEEGHKALVFSQFTSFLAIVRARLDAEGIAYTYLDGSTRDRAERVDQFQNDPACRLFLISLKAGGLGLNLTAADYVFLLDPWWNPAVEAQAIDRTHRIGQTRQVFAYRLIARDTVEEKVLELQQTKRALADAVIGADNSLIRSLTREDLSLLLG